MGPGTAPLECADHSQRALARRFDPAGHAADASREPGLQDPPPQLPHRLPMRRFSLIACTLVTGSLLAGCESLQRTDTLLGAITPYRIDIVQGNAVTREQAALIKPGMNRLQVREILGTPLVTDPFHADRWDYIFSLRRPNTQIQRRSVVVMFENNLVKSITAPDLPSERDFVASISRIKDPRATKLELSDDERKALPLPPKREAPVAEPMGPVRSYPPLEAG
jgi:outer membrane protein assembly factor BamE